VLLQDYETDSELTNFTALDGEDFHAQGDVWLINLDPTVGAEIKRPGLPLL